ncbi:MAG: S9 family peptidase [Sphaerobacter sp.]|nr:S9 family peptidase [Sphaerobacter sp.]
MTDSKRALVVEDLLALSVIADAEISPDGTTVAYVLKRADRERNTYTSAIYLAPTDGRGAAGRPQPFTAGQQQDTEPRWSPDGRQLAFVSDRSGTPQLYVMNVAGGEPRQVTTLARGVSTPQWSPDGTRIAFLSSEGNGVDDEIRNRPGGFIRRVERLQYRFDALGYIDDRFSHIWVIDVAGGAPRRLTWGDYSVHSFAWSPDGQFIAFSANQEDEANPLFHSQLYVIPVAGAAAAGARRVSQDSEIALWPAWSPDGQAIAFVGRRPGARAGANNEIYLASPAGGALRCLTEGFDRSPGTGSYSDVWSPREHALLRWTPDGRAVFFTASDRGRVGLYRATTAGEVTLVVGGDRSIGSVSQSRDGARLAFVAGTFTNPCDVYCCSADGSEERRLTQVNADLLGAVHIQEPEHFTFASFDGGFTVDAWLIRPINFDPAQRYPLVQIIHGGPHSIFGHTFFFDMQLWASQGWNVLFINPRASQGYGEAFATVNIGDWGGGDWREQETALDLAIARGGVDPERLAVTGLSYGGFMTNWIIGHTDRYRVAVSENGISNLVSFYTTSDIGWYWLEKEMERSVWDNLEWYMERSPISYVTRMKTPLLLLQAEADYRCPIEQGEQLYTALRARGVPCKMVRFPGESHAQLSAGKPETRLVRREETLRWFQRYL